MSQVSRKAYYAVIALAALTGCATHDSDVYWQDSHWDGQLLNAVQSSLHYPLDSAGNPTQPIIYGAHIVVGFRYLNGRIIDPKMVTGTGQPELDAVVLQQVKQAAIPEPYGSRAEDPHDFQLELELPNPMEPFQSATYRTISANKRYPQSAIMEGAQGAATVGFDYIGGKVSNVVIETSSGNRWLDAESIRTVSKSDLPALPPWFPSQSIHMSVTICYSLGSDSGLCQRYHHVIQIKDITPTAG